MPPAKGYAKDYGLTEFNLPDNFGIWLGYQVTEFDTEAKRVVAELKIREDHLSPSGRVHGGVISAFFDFACGAAVFTTLGKGDVCATIEIKVNYLRPIDLGDELQVVTEVIFRGKRLCVVHGFLYKKGNETEHKRQDAIAIATATFNVIMKK